MLKVKRKFNFEWSKVEVYDVFEMMLRRGYNQQDQAGTVSTIHKILKRS
jgi:hypothetical protein